MCKLEEYAKSGTIFLPRKMESLSTEYGLEDQDDAKEHNSADSRITIEIDGIKKEYKRKSLMNLIFFQTRFNERWNKTKMQQSNIISFKSLGFTLHEFDILIKFIETKKLDLTYADHATDVTELLSKLEPLVLCNDFFQYKNITSSIAEFLENYEPCITLSKQNQLFQKTNSQTLKNVITCMESTRGLQLESLYQVMNNINPTNNSCVQQLKCTSNSITNYNENENNYQADVTRLMQNLKQIYKCLLNNSGYRNIEFAATIALWKHCVRNEIIGKDELADIKNTCQKVNALKSKENRYRDDLSEQRIDMLIRIMVFDLLGLELGFGLCRDNHKQDSKQLQCQMSTTVNDEKVNSDINANDMTNKRENVHQMLELCCNYVCVTDKSEYVMPVMFDESLCDQFGNFIPVMRIDEIKKLVYLLEKTNYGSTLRYSNNSIIRYINDEQTNPKRRRRINKCKDFIDLVLNHCQNNKDKTEILHHMHGFIIPILQDPNGLEWVERTLIDKWLACAYSVGEYLDTINNNINDINHTNNTNNGMRNNNTATLTEYIDGFLHWCLIANKRASFEHKKIFKFIEIFLNHGVLFTKCQHSSIRCCFKLLIEPKPIKYCDSDDDLFTSHGSNKRKKTTKNDSPTVPIDRACKVMKQIASQLTPIQVTEVFQSMFCKQHNTDYSKLEKNHWFWKRWEDSVNWEEIETNYLMFVLLHKCDIRLLLKGNNSWILKAITGEEAQNGVMFRQWFNDKFLGSNAKDQISIKYHKQFAQAMIYIIIKENVTQLGKNVKVMNFINETLGTSLFHGPCS